MPKHSEEFKQYLTTNYLVSTEGRVKNIATGRFLKLQKDTNGYLFVRIKYDCGKVKTTYVHRMVDQAFVQDNLGSLTINHKDEVKFHNYPENLELITNEANVKLAQELSFKVISPTGASKIIRGMRQFCLDNNLTHQNMVMVAQGKRKMHKGWGCEYAVTQ